MGDHNKVIFLDSGTWQGFLDLAGALRVHGVKVARVGLRTSSPRLRAMQRLESWVLGPLSREVDGGREAGRPASISPAALAEVTGVHVLDMQIQDDLAISALEAEGGVADPRRRVAAGVDPMVLVDKRVQQLWAQKADVPTPRTWDTACSDSFPVVVKANVAFGGRGVRIAHDAEELAQAWAELTTLFGQAPYAQEYLGWAPSTGGVAMDGEALVCVAYEGRPSPGDPTGPPQTVVAIDDPVAVELTARFLRTLGYTGFFCLDWVVDAQGSPRLIDFNARVFGSWVALQAQGFDLISAYLHTLGLGPGPDGRRGQFGVAEQTMRYPCPTADSVKDVWRWRADSLGVVRARKPWLGQRWSTAMRVRTEIGALRALPVAIRRRAPRAADQDT
ncbi:unannotated protein [freshwater metagenome]|uniref:Unannotated protein n=1 Tax=freshwater metagenome TaxID=449393 RepID=A0A6J7BXR1_9ZZZZ